MQRKSKKNKLIKDMLDQRLRNKTGQGPCGHGAKRIISF